MNGPEASDKINLDLEMFMLNEKFKLLIAEYERNIQILSTINSPNSELSKKDDGKQLK